MNKHRSIEEQMMNDECGMMNKKRKIVPLPAPASSSFIIHHSSLYAEVAAGASA